MQKIIKFCRFLAGSRGRVVCEGVRRLEEAGSFIADRTNGHAYAYVTVFRLSVCRRLSVT